MVTRRVSKAQPPISSSALLPPKLAFRSVKFVHRNAAVLGPLAAWPDKHGRSTPRNDDRGAGRLLGHPATFASILGSFCLAFMGNCAIKRSRLPGVRCRR